MPSARLTTSFVNRGLSNTSRTFTTSAAARRSSPLLNSTRRATQSAQPTASPSAFAPQPASQRFSLQSFRSFSSTMAAGEYCAPALSPVKVQGRAYEWRSTCQLRSGNDPNKLPPTRSFFPPSVRRAGKIGSRFGWQQSGRERGLGLGPASAVSSSTVIGRPAGFGQVGCRASARFRLALAAEESGPSWEK